MAVRDNGKTLTFTLGAEGERIARALDRLGRREDQTDHGAERAEHGERVFHFLRLLLVHVSSYALAHKDIRTRG